jgi:hypothetical protein
MKRIFLSSLAVLIVFLSQAQIKKGTVFIGGNINFYHQSAKTDDSIYLPAYPSSSFTFYPSVGWAIKDNLVFGIVLGIGYQKNVISNLSPNYYNQQNTYSGGVFLRKYKVLGSGFSLFGQTNLAFDYGKTMYHADTTQSQETKIYGGSLNFYPGVAYSVNRHWQLETGLPGLVHLSYTHLKVTGETPISQTAHYASNTFNAGTTLSNYFQFSVGLLYII